MSRRMDISLGILLVLVVGLGVFAVAGVVYKRPAVWERLD